MHNLVAQTQTQLENLSQNPILHLVRGLHVSSPNATRAHICPELDEILSHVRISIFHLFRSESLQEFRPEARLPFGRMLGSRQKAGNIDP